ncbi:MAG: hypothetical protein M1816_006133 [Peltula sp. TS41687]|nr:MAG: hypothetical protein M1816_006133 [Peltula sp. TS41687]
MAMTVDGQQRSLGALGAFDHMQPYPAPPQFTNPWASTASAPSHLFSAPSSSSSTSASSSSYIPPPLGLDAATKQRSAGPLPYTAAPSMSAGGMPVSYGPPPPLLNLPPDLLGPQRISSDSSYGAEQAYSTTTSSSSPSHSQAYVPTPTSYDALPFSSTRTAYPSSTQGSGPTTGLTQQAVDRRLSHQPSISSTSSFLSAPLDVPRTRPTSLLDYGRGMASSPASRDGYGDAIDSGRGLVGISVTITDDDDVTPRNIYGAQSRECTDSYGFPTAHSSSSSISSASTFPSYYSSMDSSLSEYSSTSESADGLSSRTLPRPPGLLGNGSLPPAPQSMMGQFNSKVSSSGQKKHKCKICDKRFTRPSSLQTHMYSHTGEKPFCCEVDGCGRHFSVVSNLRRHRKVHRGDRETSSPDDV